MTPRLHRLLVPIALLICAAIVPAHVSAVTFTDIGDSAFRDDIVWLADAGISDGCADGWFCPTAPVARAEMATFLVRALGLPPATADYFVDDAGSFHEDDINRLAAAGLTRGCATGVFCPNAAVTREQMATFLATAFGLAEAAGDYFADDARSSHQPTINRVAAAGITRGCATWRYCPSLAVSRGEMAAFLHRAMAGGLTPPPVRGTCTRYVAPNGSDSAEGTATAPWKTLIGASGRLVPGDILCARGGTYTGQGGYGFAADGRADAPITVRSYPGERAVFDGAGKPQWVILADVDHVVFRDLTITRYNPENNGVVILINGTDDVVLDGLTVTGNWGTSPAGYWNEHAIYPGAGVGSIVLRNSVIDAAGLPGGAVHVFHDPGPRSFVIENNVLRNGHWGVIVASNARYVLIRNNSMSGNAIAIESWDREGRLEVYGNAPGNWVR